MNNKSLNILYHHRTQGRGAEGVHISSIVRSLEKLGHQVTVISPPGIDPMSNAGNAPIDKSRVKTSGINTVWKFISKHLPNFLFEAIEIIYNIPSSIRIEKELRNKQYDIIYERYAFYMVSGVIKANKYNIPFVLEANEVNGIKDRARKQSFSFLCNYFEKFLFHRCTSIHTVSSYLKNMIIDQGVSSEKISVIPNAIDPDRFTGKKCEVDVLRERYNLNNKTIIGFAGWFDNWDRLDLLIEVYRDLKPELPELALLLIGDGDVLNDVREFVEKYDLQDVVLTGAVDRSQIHQYLSLLDIAVITHSNEFGSPVVMFEFMGLKIPIIAPKLLPVTDVLMDHETALLFDILDMNQLSDAIRLLASDTGLSSKISEKAYDLLVSKHTWIRNAEHIIESSETTHRS